MNILMDIYIYIICAGKFDHLWQNDKINRNRIRYKVMPTQLNIFHSLMMIMTMSVMTINEEMASDCGFKRQFEAILY